VPQEIVSDLVANVIKIMVATGDKVDAGDTIALLESMKMEIPVLAEEPGTVSEINVAEGDVVQEGDVLAVVE
jgi:acetyl-CoA carboxylase biotin carboxyl carrier protein